MHCKCIVNNKYLAETIRRNLSSVVLIPACGNGNPEFAMQTTRQRATLDRTLHKWLID